MPTQADSQTMGVGFSSWENWPVILYNQRMELLSLGFWRRRKLVMVVSNNNNSSMSGRKHLLDDHRDVVDYRQISVSVFVVPVPVPPGHQGDGLPYTNHIQMERQLGMELNAIIPHEGKQAHVVRRDESMVFFQRANRYGWHRPISRMPVGLGTELTSTKPQCVSERDTTYTE